MFVRVVERERVTVLVLGDARGSRAVVETALAVIVDITVIVVAEPVTVEVVGSTGRPSDPRPPV